MMNAGMPMPAASASMPMPSYDHGQPYARVDLKPMPESTSSPSQGHRIWPRIYVSTLESSQGFCYKDIAFIMYELMGPSSGRGIYIHYTLVLPFSALLLLFSR
jgi:hypothetical protein